MAEPWDGVVEQAEAFANAKLGEYLPGDTHIEFHSEPLIPVDDSLWGLHKAFEGIDPATPLPTSLDARRSARADDGLTHCGTCGGHVFTASVVFDAGGQPAQILTPQRCIGCGELRQSAWPS